MNGQGDVPAQDRTVRGEVVLPAGEPGERAVQLIVQVEDVSRMDAPSQVIAEQRIEDVPLDGTSVEFEIAVPAGLIDERASYSLRVHVDLSGSGEVERGDMITTQSYPVLTHAAPDSARIEVRRI